jgi:hypothetical protein
MKITIYGWSTSEASPQTAEVPTIVTGSRSGQSAIRANSIKDPRSVRPTAAVRCAEVRSASRPAGHSESGWSDNVSADVERTPDATSSSENLTQTSRTRRPKIARDRIGRPGTARSILALEKRELGKLCRTAH